MKSNDKPNFYQNGGKAHPHFCSDDLRPELCVSPWAGHRNFAYDLVSFVKPHRIVELGTHYGCSFFAFLQASKDGGLNTEHIAVDTWVGDDHAGHYSEEVFEFFNKTLQSLFESQRVLVLRKTFDDALEYISDGSVDLLHIDGFHSHEAVSHDYRMWLPKLADNGIVLFHDVAPSSGYGSSVFWNNVKNNIPHFEFLEHSFGLGILFPKGSDKYSVLARHLNSDTLDLYRFKAEYELKNIQLSDAGHTLESRWAAMQSMEALIRERDEVIAGQARMLEERWAAMQSMEALIRERDATIIEQRQLIEKRAITI